MNAYRTGPAHQLRQARPIMAVEITNHRGEVVADVDAASTADALAYYLRSRRIDENATEDSVWAEVAGASWGIEDDECIIRYTHDWDGSIMHHLTLVAAVK